MQRYDLLSPRANKSTGKTHWQKIGAGFPRDKGGFSLVFDALPLPDAEGRVSLLMVEPMDRDAPREKPVSGAPAGGAAAYDNDEIPFAPEFR